MRYFLALAFLASSPVHAQRITTAGQPAQLDVRVAGERSIRVTLKPTSYAPNFPSTPVVAQRTYPAPIISLRQIASPVSRRVGNFNVQVRPNPLTLVITTT